MAITVEEALGIARGHLGSDGIELYVADRGYIASVDRAPDCARPGDMPILIDKETAEVTEVLLPSEEGFRLLGSARRFRRAR